VAFVAFAEQCHQRGQADSFVDKAVAKPATHPASGLTNTCSLNRGEDHSSKLGRQLPLTGVRAGREHYN
jgi:hypothetical protein